MRAAARRLAARLWPVVRLRSLLLATLLLVAALPGVAALFLRVYENTLVRRTEAEVIAQGAALAAGAAALWPQGAASVAAPLPPASDYDGSTLDLRTAPVLAERPAARRTAQAPDSAAVAVAARMVPVLRETQGYTLASLILIDRQGVVLTGRDRGLSLAALPEVRAALAGRGVTVLRHNDRYASGSPLGWISRATDLRLHRAQPVMVGGRAVGVVLVSRSSAALFRGMWEDRGKIAAGVVLIFAMLVGLTAVLARAIVRPVEELSEAARALARGAPAAPPRPTLQVVEIRSLVADFAAMAAAIEYRSRYLRDFAAALAHEFKTPLAGLAGGIELLQDHGPTMAEEERARFLANMAGDARRLNRLVSRLMELAQADMRGADAHAASALAPLCARLADALAAPGFALDLDLPAALPPLAVDGPALETVLATLVENARQAGATRVTVRASARGDTVTVDLADDGPGIAPGDRARVFEPFFTNRRTSGGTGLGLPIARALLAASGGTLELVESERGARFRLTVSAA